MEQQEQTQEQRYTVADVIGWLNDRESLEYADLSESKLHGINLSKVNLKGASLEHADLRGASFSEAILTDVNLQRAFLMRADLSGANLEGADLNMSTLDNANLSKTCFKNAILRNASMRSVDVTNADFTNANLHEANLIGAIGCLAKSFKLTEQFFSELRKATIPETAKNSKKKETIPEDIIQKLYGLKNQEFKTEKDFLTALKKTTRKAFNTERYKLLILNHVCATAARKFQHADLTGTDLEHTGLNANDLRLIGAKIDATTKGLTTRVFDFFRISQYKLWS